MTTKAAQKGKATSGNLKISKKLIRERAEQIYRQRTEEGTPGDAESDWLRAEQELKTL